MSEDERVRHEILTPPTLRTRHPLLARTRREDAFVVPLAVCVLSEVHDGTVDLHETQQQALVEQIARIEPNR